MQATTLASTPAAALQLPRAMPARRLAASSPAGLGRPAARTAPRVMAMQNDERPPGSGEAGPLTPVFSRRREHAVGRVAALGFAFSLAGELLTGLGPMAQLHFETGARYGWIYLAIIGFTVHGLWSLRPGSPTWSRGNQEDVIHRSSRLMVPVNVGPFSQPRKFLAQNEVLIGRIAMAGFGGACLLEYLYGGEAPLAHLGLITPGQPLTEAPWWALGLITLCLLTGLGFFSQPLDRDTDSNF